MATTDMTMRVDKTTFIASSHSEILSMTRNHLQKIASSLEHNLGADVSYL
jgi:hypothetical protein